MSFLTSANRMYVTDGGTTVFDTDDRLFTVTDTITNSFTLPGRTATEIASPFSQSPVVVNTNHTLHSINSSANTVRGSFKVTATVTGGGSSRLTGVGWFNASGTYVHMLHARRPALSPGSTDNAGLPSISAYTFIASGGSLILNEQCIMRADPTGGGISSTSLSLPGATLEYHLFCGAWI